MDDIREYIENEEGRFRLEVWDTNKGHALGYVKWQVSVWEPEIGLWRHLTLESRPMLADLALEEGRKYLKSVAFGADIPEPDKTVVGLDELFFRLAEKGINWEVKSLSRAGDGFVPGVEVGGFTIHLPEGDLTTDKLLAALKEGYDRVMRYREHQRHNPPKLHKPEVGRDG